jgi:hypothetical protein
MVFQEPRSHGEGTENTEKEEWNLFRALRVTYLSGWKDPCSPCFRGKKMFNAQLVKVNGHRLPE